MEPPSRPQHDQEAAAALAAIAARHRRELERLLGDPPDIANVPFEFWAKVQQDMEDELASILLLVFIASAEFHGAPSSQAATQGITWARPVAQFASSSYAQTGVEMLAGYTQNWRQQTGAGETINRQAIVEDTTRVFGPNRASRVAVDGVTTAQTAGGEWAVDMFFGLSPDDLWINQPQMSLTGPCPICEPLHRKPRSEWSAQFPSGPPGPHPGCVCTVEYANANIPALS